MRALNYSSSLRNLKDIIQYFGYPMAKAVGLMVFKNEYKANLWANMFGTVCYGMITSNWFGKEAKSFDDNCRLAVCAELGIDPDKFRFSDFFDSKNAIVGQERGDLFRINKIRYATDLTFLLPMVLTFLRGFAPASAQGFLPSDESIFGLGRNEFKETSAEALQEGINGAVRESRLPDWIYAIKSGYWAWETFSLEKTAHYEVSKLQERLAPYHIDIDTNSLVPIFQLARRDLGMKKLTGEALKETRKLLDELVSICNDDKDNAVANIVYFIGMDKMNILDNYGNISASAITHIRDELDMLREKGLQGIIEAKIASSDKVTGNNHAKPRGFVERLKRSSANMAYGTYNVVLGFGPNHLARESDRDPTEGGAMLR